MKNYLYLINYIFFIFISFIFIYGCMYPIQTSNDSDLQKLAIDERLQGLNLSAVEIACDDCNFYVQEAILKQTARKNENQIGGSRSKTGVRVYIFDNVSIEQAFFMILDSNIFAEGINRELKFRLMDAIKLGKNDFSNMNTIDEIDIKEFSSLSYARRLNNNASLPRAMLDSVETIESDDETSYNSNSLEGFIVDRQIIVLHFYSESYSWDRR